MPSGQDVLDHSNNNEISSQSESSECSLTPLLGNRVWICDSCISAMIASNDVVIVAEVEIERDTEDSVHNTSWEMIYRVDEANHLANFVYCRDIISNAGTCNAEILFVNDWTVQKTVRKTFRLGDFVSYHGDCAKVVIRILEEKEKYVNEFQTRWANDVIFVVNGKRCHGDRKYMAAISPVFEKMLNGHFAETRMNEIELQGIDSSTTFKDFLLSICPLRVQPNPANVVTLLELAHQYDIPFLVDACAKRLRRCYEISLVERILLAGTYDLDCLKMYIAHRLSDVDWNRLRADQWELLRTFGIDFFMNKFFKQLTC